MAKIRVGVSGWSYEQWRDRFYPEALPQKDRLHWISRRFDATEINASFYSLRKASSYRAWRDAAPRDHRFAVKGSRYVTHAKKLRDPRAGLANFFASGVLELGERLAPFLWQLPANLGFDAERLERFLETLPRDTDEAGELASEHDDRVAEPVTRSPDGTHRLRHALEVRHESYLEPQALRILKRRGIALVFSHGDQWSYAEDVTAGFVYLRLHGPDELYASPYSDDELRVWADRVHAWQSADEPPDAHRATRVVAPTRKGRDVYVFFDNDAEAYAPHNALRLRELLDDSPQRS